MHVTAGIKTRKRNNFAWHSRPRGRVWGEGGSAPPAMEPSLQLCARLSAYLQDVTFSYTCMFHFRYCLWIVKLKLSA